MEQREVLTRLKFIDQTSEHHVWIPHVFSLKILQQIVCSSDFLTYIPLGEILFLLLFTAYSTMGNNLPLSLASPYTMANKVSLDWKPIIFECLPPQCIFLITAKCKTTLLSKHKELVMMKWSQWVQQYISILVVKWWNGDIPIDEWWYSETTWFF